MAELKQHTQSIVSIKIDDESFLSIRGAWHVSVAEIMTGQHFSLSGSTSKITAMPGETQPINLKQTDIIFTLDDDAIIMLHSYLSGYLKCRKRNYKQDS